MYNIHKRNKNYFGFWMMRETCIHYRRYVHYKLHSGTPFGDIYFFKKINSSDGRYMERGRNFQVS